MKKWLSFFLILAIFTGLASRVEAMTNLQISERTLEEIERISQISDPLAQLQSIKEFVKQVQGMGLSREQEKSVIEHINKMAVEAGNKWCVVEEIPLKNQKGSYHVGAYYATRPPADAKKIQ